LLDLLLLVVFGIDIKKFSVQIYYLVDIYWRRDLVKTNGVLTG